MKDLVIVHSPEYANWVFDPEHPTQGRRFINGFNALTMHAEERGLNYTVMEPAEPTLADLRHIHSNEYLVKVLSNHESNEWDGPRPDLSHLAKLFVGGTLTAYEALVHGWALTAAHLPGAKHHAQYDHSSGFCVFADFAITARKAISEGYRVAILDIDAHHGDGTENLTKHYSDVLTYSVHEDGIFPGTGMEDEPYLNVYNWPLAHKSGDRDLQHAVADFLTVAGAFKPTMIFIAGGADGHQTDPLSSLNYSLEGMARVMQSVRERFPVTPILFGGAGGYRPDGATPLAWARMVTELAT